MSDALGFPVQFVALMAAAALSFTLVILSPALMATFVAWRRRAAMPQRLLFVVVATFATYGTLVFVLLVAWIPFEAFMILVVPALRSQGYMEHSILIMLYNFSIDWWWGLVPLVILSASTMVTRYLSARWHKIAEAMHVG